MHLVHCFFQELILNLEVVQYNIVDTIAGTDYWDLIGPPLSGYSVEDFTFDNNDIATNGSSPTTYAVGYYTNTTAASSSNGGWTNYTSDTYDTNMVSGKGYQMSTDGTATGAEVNFEGTLLTSNVQITVTTNEAGKCFKFRRNKI